jgi:AraC-like DNA-binding protein
VRSRWSGSILFSDRALVYLGPVASTDVHAHHAVQIAVGVSDALVLADASGYEAHGEAFVVTADTPHAIRRACERALLVFVDPQDAIGHTISASVPGPTPEDWARAAAPCSLRPVAESGDLRAAAAEVLAAFAVPEREPPELHPAVKAALRLLPDLVAETKPSLATLAKRVGVSESRLSHLFGEQVGISLRPYVLWLRLRRATLEISRGKSLTEAAHVAGFSDSAHLSNTFRRMFGVAPSDLAGHASWVD